MLLSAPLPHLVAHTSIPRTELSIVIASWRLSVLALPSGQLKPVNVMKITDVAAN
jgi:hypothetical protein